MRAYRYKAPGGPGVAASLYPDMSLSEIAAELGLKGSERVRQIEAQALGKLKVELERRGYQMSDFLEMVDDNSAWNRRHTKSHI